MLWKKRNSNRSFALNHVMPALNLIQGPRHLLYCLISVALAVNFVGCANEVSVDQKFVNLFVELRVTEITYGKDSPMSRLVRQDALKAAGYTREQFLAKTEEILNDERQWVPFQKAVNARIDSLLALPADDNAAGATVKGSPVNKAPGQPPHAAPSRKSVPQMPAHKGGVP